MYFMVLAGIGWCWPELDWETNAQGTKELVQTDHLA